MTFDTSSTRCSTSRTPGASGGIYPSSSDPERGSGLSFAGGRGTERGLRCLWRCTRCCAPTSVERNHCPRWWSSTRIWREGSPMAEQRSITRAIPMAEPRAPSESSAWTSLVCRFACVRFPYRRPKQSHRVDTRRPFPQGSDKRIELVLMDRGTAPSAAHRLSATLTQRAARWIVSLTAWPLNCTRPSAVAVFATPFPLVSIVGSCPFASPPTRTVLPSKSSRGENTQRSAAHAQAANQALARTTPGSKGRERARSRLANCFSPQSDL